jgi:hypothetical protein
VLLDAGIARALGVARIDQVDRIAYETREQPGTRIRNGRVIRAFSLTLAEKVATSMSAGDLIGGRDGSGIGHRTRRVAADRVAESARTAGGR